MNILTDGELPKIIEVINYLGSDLVEWLEYINNLVSMVGVPGFVIVLWAVMPLVLTVLLITVMSIGAKQSRQNNKAFTKQMESLTIAINHLSDKVLDPPMNLEDSMDYFYLVMKDHVMQKLRYLGDILRANSIHVREKQITKNIENEFRSITTKEANKLSRKKSVCGDMGKVLQENLDWDLFLQEVYDLFFAPRDENVNNPDHLKIKDIEKVMHGKIDLLAKIIEDNGVHN